MPKKQINKSFKKSNSIFYYLFFFFFFFSCYIKPLKKNIFKDQWKSLNCSFSNFHWKALQTLSSLRTSLFDQKAFFRFDNGAGILNLKNLNDTFLENRIQVDLVDTYLVHLKVNIGICDSLWQKYNNKSLYQLLALTFESQCLLSWKERYLFLLCLTVTPLKSKNFQWKNWQ